MFLLHRLACGVRRRPVLSVLWVAACTLLIVQNVRLGRFMIDPAADWWLTTRNEFWAKHACLPAYIVAADLQRQGEPNVYDARHYAALVRDAKPRLTVANLEGFAGDPFQYPPPFLLLPTAALALTNDYLAIRTGWFVIESLAFVIVWLLVAAWVGGREGTAAALLVPVAWLSIPVMQNLQFGQFHLVALLLAVGGMVAFERRHHAAGGALLAAAILSKIFPGVLLVLLAVQRRWRAAAWTAAFAALFSAAALLAFGPGPFDTFVRYQLPRMASGEAFDFAREWPEYRAALIANNLSPAGLVAKLHELGVPGTSPAVGTLVLKIYAAGVLAVTLVTGWRRRAMDPASALRTWLALLNLAVFQAGGAWGDYVTVGAAWLLTYLAQDFARSRWTAAFLAASWAACLLVPGALPVPTLLPVPLAMLLTAVVAALAISLNVWVLFRRSPSGTPGPSDVPTSGLAVPRAALTP